MSNMLLVSGRKAGAVWLFNQELDHVFGFHDQNRLIAEDKFRIIFSPDRNRNNLIAFAFIGWCIAV